VLVLAPTGRDCSLTCAILEERAGVTARACADVGDLCREIAQGAGAAVIAEEALESGSARRLFEMLGQQLPWSDLPLILLMTATDVTSSGVPVASLRQSGNVTILERPLRIVSLLSSVQAALRARRRQYQVRDLLAALRTAVRHRDEFLAMLGHELRNPLAAISAAMSVIDASSAPADDFDREQREIIQRQTMHLARLVDDLLDVSRITTGKIALQKRVVDLCEVARSAVRTVEPGARAQRHELNIQTLCNTAFVEGDPVRLEQVINNLLTNAIKYTPNGGKLVVTIEIKGDDVVLRVKDDGLGIPAELLPRIFELFTQADRSLDRSQGGMGIGLTLVRSLVEMHGGTVAAHSDGPGRGSEFTVMLPRVNVPTQETALGGGNGDHPVRTNGEDHGSRHVLIVEDQPDARRALQRLLQIWGHRVDVAEDGPRAVKMAPELRPEVALVDIGLPGLDGYAVARELRSQLGNSIRLIALTGYGQPDDHVRTREAGFDMHLVKPVDAKQLSRVLGGEKARS